MSAGAFALGCGRHLQMLTADGGMTKLGGSCSNLNSDISCSCSSSQKTNCNGDDNKGVKEKQTVLPSGLSSSCAVDKNGQWPAGSNAVLRFWIHFAQLRHVSSADGVPKKDGRGQVFVSNGRYYMHDPCKRDLLLSSDGIINNNNEKKPQCQDTHARTFDLRIGKGFVFSALERSVQAMQIGEHAKFLIAPEYASGLKSLAFSMYKEREATENKDTLRSGCLGCVAHACSATTSKPDEATKKALDDAVNVPETEPLMLTVDLLDVQLPGTFDLHASEMNSRTRFQSAQNARKKAIELFKQEKFESAQSYCEKQLNLLTCERTAVIAAGGTRSGYNADKLKTVDAMLHKCRVTCALCSLRLGKYRQAYSQFSEALTREPKSTACMFYRAVASIASRREAKNDDYSNARYSGGCGDLDMARSDLEACTRGPNAIEKSNKEWIHAKAELEELTRHRESSAMPALRGALLKSTSNAS